MSDPESKCKIRVIYNITLFRFPPVTKQQQERELLGYRKAIIKSKFKAKIPLL